MLSELYIENIAVIEKISVRFESGFNVFTGETGAGKSILIDAINSVLGQRTSKEIVRTGEKKGSVTTLWNQIPKRCLDYIKDNEICEIENDELLITREIYSDGRTVCRINGKPVTLTILREITSKLINIHGQHDSQSLLDPARHMSFIDAFGNLAGDIAKYKESYQKLVELKRKFERLNTSESEREERISLLEYQIKEITDAFLIENEYETLTIEKNEIQNAEMILSNLCSAIDNLADENAEISAIEQIMKSGESLAKISVFLEETSGISEKIVGIAYELQEYAAEIRRIKDNFFYDPSRITFIEERLDLIYNLRKKYGESESEINDYATKAAEELSQMQDSNELKEKLKNDLIAVKEKTVKLAGKLSEKRKKSGADFIAGVTSELQFLDLPSVKMTVQNNGGKITANGTDSLEFLVSTNPGLPPKPMAKIASGGELSRIMLAMKNVISDKDEIATLIFDEIDTGVSGKAAGKIGQKLKQLSNSHQVICITHTAQIAALADNHIFINKVSNGNSTRTIAKQLERHERIAELARIMSGDNITELTLKNAEEMLEIVSKK